MQITRALRTIGALLICVALAGPALAEMRVYGPFVDVDTGGDWRGTYGDCFFMIPDPEEASTRYYAGPDWYSEAPSQYRYVSCYGGPIFSQNPDVSKVDWKLYRDRPNNPAVTVFRTERDLIDRSEQWNPCLQATGQTTFTNGSVSHDPLTLELNLDIRGDIRLAYFFTTSVLVCREQLVTLVIDGEIVAEGSVGDFAIGKYVVFDIERFFPPEGGSVITLETEDAPGDPDCDVGPITGPNTHLSAVFVSKLHPASDVCPPVAHGQDDSGDGGGSTDPPAEAIVSEDPSPTGGSMFGR